MKRVLALLLAVLVCLPAFAENQAAAIHVEAAPHAVRFSFELASEQYVLVQYATRNDTGKMVLYSPEGVFSGVCYLPGTDTEEQLRISVSNLRERTLLRSFTTTAAVEDVQQPSPELDPTVRAAGSVREPVITVEGSSVHYSFSVPGRKSVLLRCRTPQESHTVRLFAGNEYRYEGAIELPLSYPDDRVTVTVLTDGSNTELYQDELLLPYAAPEAVAQAAEGPLSGVTVCIDPGHQRLTQIETVLLGPGFTKTTTTTVGMAKGASTQRRESIVVLEIAFQLRDALLQQGAKVIMTRESQDVFVGMLERADIPNDAGADFVLRLHCNSRDNPNVQGIQIYCPYQSEYAQLVATEDEYRKMGFALLDAMKASTGTNDGTCKLNNSYVGNNWSKMPSFLVEMGYLSNPEEDLKMTTAVYQAQLVAGMVDGVIALAGLRGLTK